MSGGIVGTDRGSFCFLRVPVSQNDCLMEVMLSVFRVHWVSVIALSRPHVNNQFRTSLQDTKILMFLLSDIEKFIDQRETKATDVDPSIVGQHVRPLKNNYFKPSIWMGFFLRFEITKTFHDTKIYLVPGDGHCLIYSWKLLSWILRKCSWAMLCFMQSNQYGIPEDHNEYTSFLISRSPYK